MSQDIDLSGEHDPTDRMIEQNERAHERAERDENERDSGHDGTVETEAFDLSEALADL
jgi:hypothetical protein